MPLRFFRNRGFAAGNGACSSPSRRCSPASSCSRSSCRRCSATGRSETGLRLMPWTITFILVAPAAGALADRIGERALMAAGLALQRGRAGLAGADRGRGHRLHRACSARSSSPGSASRWRSRRARTRSCAAISLAEVGKAAGANSMMRELGGVFGIAVAVAVFGAAGGYRLGGRVRRRLRAGGRRRGRVRRRSGRWSRRRCRPGGPPGHSQSEPEAEGSRA